MVYSSEIIFSLTRCLAALHLAPSFKEGLSAFFPYLADIFSCRFAIVDELPNEGIRTIHASASFNESKLVTHDFVHSRSGARLSTLHDSAQLDDWDAYSTKPITVSFHDETELRAELQEQAAGRDLSCLVLRARTSPLGLTLVRTGPFNIEELVLASVLLKQMDLMLSRDRLSRSDSPAQSRNRCSLRVTRNGDCLQDLPACAAELFNRHFGTTCVFPFRQLPNELIDWISAHDRRFARERNNGEKGETKHFPSPRGELCAAISHTPTPNELMISLWERSDQSDWFELRQLGLTARECEVIYWLYQGKRDGEIAMILELASKTISKHVEHILRKLNAESRFVAARMAEEFLRRGASTQSDLANRPVPEELFTMCAATA